MRSTLLSGDQLGNRPWATIFFSRVARVTTQTSHWPLRPPMLQYASREPSGLKLGCMSCEGPDVICVTFRPSTSIVYRSQLPARVEQNAIDLPSGLNDGWAFSDGSLVSW